MQGHVDGVGTVVRRRPSEHWEVVEVSLPAELARYVVPKGSICVDGVSLTVVDVGADSFTVSLIPETLARTTLGTRQPGDRVNLETDVIARHVEKLLPHYLAAYAPIDRSRLMTITPSASTASSAPSPTSPPARPSSSSTTRTARTRAT